MVEDCGEDGVGAVRKLEALEQRLDAPCAHISRHPVQVAEAVEVFGPVMMNMFGQAEANGPIAFLLPTEHRPNDGPKWKRRLQAIGRPSLLRARVDGSGETVAAVRVGGEVVMLARGEMWLP